MSSEAQDPVGPKGPKRLSASARRLQLLSVAMTIVREEGADRLTLGHLASRAGVSKPVAYDHFNTRSDLLIDLYQWIDSERVNAFRHTMQAGQHTAGEAILALAGAYIDCAADTQGEFFAIGAALAGSDEKATVLQDLLDNYVAMFAEVLRPHTTLDSGVLSRRCVGLVGAGESLSSEVVRKQIERMDAVETLAVLIRGALDTGRVAKIV